jgi:hypothetical protein
MAALAGTVAPISGMARVLTMTQGFLLNGIEFSGPLGWLILSFITACPGIGQLGFNHIMTGQPMVAILKTFSLILSVFLTIILFPYLPLALQGPWVFYLSLIGPWYIFDVIQIFLGYNIGYFSMIDLEFIPLSGPGGKTPGGKNGKWNLTVSNMNILFTAIAACGQVVPMVFGPSSSEIGNIISYIGAGLLGISGTLSLAATLFASPLGAAASAVAGLPGVAPKTFYGGGALPPLSEILDKIPTHQAGGAASASSHKSDTLFLQGLGFVSIAGIALGLLRAKQRPRIPTIG